MPGPPHSPLASLLTAWDMNGVSVKSRRAGEEQIESGYSPIFRPIQMEG